jgi:hypothetical protein
MMQDRLIFVSFLLLLLVLCAIVGKDQGKGQAMAGAAEHFDANADSQDNRFVITKSYTYYPFVLTTFMSDNSTNNSLINIACPMSAAKQTMPECQALLLFKFLPTYLDTLCSMVPSAKSNCDNAFVDNNASADPYYFDSWQVCTTVGGSIGKETVVRIMNNNYNFFKRCITLPIASVVLVSGTESTYKVVLTTGPSYDLLALLRPCMISFPGIGLFSISLFKTGASASMFTSYSNKGAGVGAYASQAGAGEAKVFYMVPVKVPSSVETPKPQLFHPTGSESTITSLKDGVATSPTIYYFNYKEPADYFKTAAKYNTPTNPLTFNTLSLIFDQNNIGTKTISVASTYNFNSCSQLQFVWDAQATDMTISIASSLAGGGFSTKLPADFVSAMQAAKSTGNGAVVYHIVVSYSVDLLTIVCLLKDLTSQTNQSNVFMKQAAVVAGSSQAIYLQYAMNEVPADVMGNASACDQTAVPNMATLAKQLGYLV